MDNIIFQTIKLFNLKIINSFLINILILLNILKKMMLYNHN